MADYLVHFNPNHDKLGRFTFSKTTPEQRANYKYLKDSYKGVSPLEGYNKTERRANELTKKFSKEYNERFNEKIKSINSRKDLSKVTSEDLFEYTGLDSEVETLLGKYKDKVWDKRMGDTYAELIKRNEFNKFWEATKEIRIKGD